VFLSASGGEYVHKGHDEIVSRIKKIQAELSTSTTFLSLTAALSRAQ